MNRLQEYIIDGIEPSASQEVIVNYYDKKEFTTLEALQKAGVVKLYFYKKVISHSTLHPVSLYIYLNSN
jgi:hypothetical protein